MHPMFIMFLMIAGVVLTTIIFVFWVVITIVRGAGRLLLGSSRPPRPLPMINRGVAPGPLRPCDRISCRALNPMEARFCRRCGQNFVPGQATVRRTVMF